VKRPEAPTLRQTLLALLLFFALTVPLVVVWMRWGLAWYVTFLVWVLQAFHHAQGWAFTGKGIPGLSIRFVSLVPFVILVLVTPALSWRRRLVGSLVGVLLIVASHLFVLTLANAAFAAGRGAIGRILPFIFLMDGLPLGIWLVVARDFLRHVVPGLGEAPARGGEPD
jgi:hypothetical protein